MTKNAKAMRSAAERAAVWYAHIVHGCIITRRAVRTQFQSVDMFAADIVGKHQDGSHVYLQVTAGQSSAVTARRRKLEKIPWHESDTVELLQLVQTENPANARRKLWFFRVHVYNEAGWSTKEEALAIPKEWFKSYEA